MNRCVYKYMMVVTVILGVVSCSQEGKYDFRSGDDAIKAYCGYLHEVRAKSKSDTKDMVDELCRWREVNDTVWGYLQSNKVYLEAHGHKAQFADIHDSVRTEMLRLAETWQYGYGDVLEIKRQTSSFRDDQELKKAVKEVETMFEGMDSVATLSCDSKAVLMRYKGFLAEQKGKTFKSKEEVIAFLRQEDVMFRSFLGCLYEMEGESLTDITRYTESVCTNIFMAAREKRVSAKDVMVLMSMRTSRRLLQNAETCVRDIERKDIKSAAQGNAYLWMIIQPFISIDQFGMAALTKEEMREFEYVCRQIPRSERFAKAFDIDRRSLNYLLPRQLLRIYILSC